MTIIIHHRAAALWRRGETVMTHVDVVDLPHWPVRMRGVWIESPNPETHRVADCTRQEAPETAQRYLDEIDAAMVSGAIEIVKQQEDNE